MGGPGSPVHGRHHGRDRPQPRALARDGALAPQEPLPQARGQLARGRRPRRVATALPVGPQRLESAPAVASAAMSLPRWMEPLLDAGEMRETDRWAITEQGIAEEALMERAGEGLA